MDGEDWPDPLPKGWTLKKYSNGKVIQHFHCISIEIFCFQGFYRSSTPIRTNFMGF